MESALYELCDEEPPRLIAAKETERRAAELLGVGLDQFRQIILLPQGEFRRLLLADSRERQGIMQQLFHTEIYAKLEQDMRRGRRSTRRPTRRQRRSSGRGSRRAARPRWRRWRR